MIPEAVTRALPVLAGAPARTLNARILVVDDDPAILHLVTAILERIGYIVERAADGAEAIEALQAHSFDLVLLDLNLPKHSGVDILMRIRATSSAKLLPVVIFTSSDDQHKHIMAIKEGATDFIHKPFDVVEFVARIRALVSLKFYTDELESAKDVVACLAGMVDARDPYTAGHSVSVSFYASLLGKRINLSERDLETLRLGTLFHDVGKIVIPDNILLKPGPLTQDEFAVIKLHPAEGRRLLSHLRTLNDAIPIVYHHHEKLDGSGYPDGLSGADIALLVRIASIADVYDAITTERPYRSANSPAEAFEILSGEAAKGWWDRELVAEFISALSETLSRISG